MNPPPRHRRLRPSRYWRRTGYGLLVAILAGGVFTRGYVYEDGLRMLAWMLCATFALWAVYGHFRGYLLARTSEPLWRVAALLAIATSAAGIFILPLPAGLTLRLQPLWAQAAGYFETAGIPLPGALPLATAPENAWRAFHQLVAMTSFFIGLTGLAGFRAGRRVIRDAILFSALVEGLAGLLNYSFSGDGRASGILYSPNHHASFLMMALPLGAVIFLQMWKDIDMRAENDRAPFFGVLLLLVMTSWLLSLSRGSLLAIGLMLLIWVPIEFAIARQERRRRKPLSRRALAGMAGAAVAAFAVLIASAAVPALYERISGRSGTALSRIELWVVTLRGWLDAPLTGLGPGGTQYALNRLLTNTRSDATAVYTHNDYIQFLADFGAIVTILMLLALIWLLRGIVHAVRASEDEGPLFLTPVRRAALAGLAAALIHALVDFHLRIPSIGFQALMLTALGLSPGISIAPKR